MDSCTVLAAWRLKTFARSIKQNRGTLMQKNQAHFAQRLAKVFRDIEAAAAPTAVQENFKGVSVTLPDDLNGAIVHDAAVVYAKLPKQHQERFARELRALVGGYLPLTRGLKILEPAKGDFLILVK